MKVALILSVVALVAVSQPYYNPDFNPDYPPHPFNPCELKAFDMECCIPFRPQNGLFGCEAPPRSMYPPPRGYLPPPMFLDDACCKKGTECCIKDDTALPVFECCDSTEECVMTNGKGVCTAKAANAGTTPNVPHLEVGGQCPEDGSLALEVRPGEPFRCTFNTDVSGYKCPSKSHCVRDNTGNQNSGVCCRDTVVVNDNQDSTIIGCNAYTDCHSCVRNNNTNVKAACGWLTQGSVSNNMPRCVINCDNFPSKSCVKPSSGHLCPANNANGNNSTSTSTIVNTGTCERRCAYIGTGRAAGINNNGNRPTTPSNASAVVKDACCTDYPGDYCCDGWGQLATHCNRGRVPGGPMCGVPMKGTPNALYVPENEPLGPYMPAPYGSGPTPFGPMPPYGEPHGYGPHRPMGPGPYGPGPMPYGPGPMPYGPVAGPYGPYGPWRDAEGEDVDAVVKMLFFAPPPMFYPVPPPPVPQRIPSVVDVNPSPFVCSCDDMCGEYADCCSDYAANCVF